MKRTTWARTAVSMICAGIVMVGMTAVAGPVLAAPTDSNPGTVKIEVAGQEVDVPVGNQDNDPHVDCSFQIVYEGATTYAGDPITAKLSVQAPATPTDQVVYTSPPTTLDSSGDATITVNAGDLNLAGVTANHTENGNNDSDKQDTGDPNELTYHVKLSSLVNGTEIYPKQKTFWIGGCESSPTLSTSATANATTGSTASDTATLAGFNTLAAPTGTITFELWAPGTCGVDGATPVFTSDPVTISPTGTASSGSQTVTALGTYQWTASYSGDVNNNPVTEGCGGANEQTVVTPLPTPSLSTSATPDATAGSTASDTATLTGFSTSATLSGTITFELWAPGTCGVAGHTPVFTSDPPVNVSPTGTASSGPQTVANVGTYQWTASYSGDAHNNPVTEGCGGDHEQTVVTTLPTPALSTNAESSAVTGTTVTDTATLAGFVPGAATAGHITFDLWKTSTCSGEGALVGSSTVAVTASPVTSGLVGPVTTAGTYYWTASYTGDANNNPVSEACGGANETTTVTTAPGIVFTPPPTSPGLTITKSVNQTTLVAPGLLTYTVVVANPGTAPASNVVITDANPPNTLFESLSQSGTVFSCTTPAVNTAGTISCTAPSLAAGASTTFTIVDEVTAAADGTTVINTAIAAATGLTPPPATVTTVIPVPPVTAPSVAPELAITKSVNDATLVAPAELTYTVVVSNPGSATATDVVMTDPNPPNTLFESLSQTGPAFTCTTPAVNTAGLITCTAPSLAAGASTTFTIVDEVTAAADGTTVVNTSTATATGLTPPPASAQTVIPVPPVAVLATNASQAPTPTAVRAASTLPLTGTDVRGLLAAGIGLILCGLGLFAKSARMEPKRT